jgi:hypothetical protein
MKILHISPHFGGGIAPATIGIIESTNSVHTLFEIERTQDTASLEILESYGVKPLSIYSSTSDTEHEIVYDLVIFHYWDSSIWPKLIDSRFTFLARQLVLLNHRSIQYNGAQARYIAEYFDICVQSGYIEEELPSGWHLIPTCRSKTVKFREDFPQSIRALYLGTLSFKKVSEDFFNLANQLSSLNIELDIYGNLIDQSFSKELEKNSNTMISYRGYIKDKALLQNKYTFLLYPLRPDHYGTTENSLLENMLEGIIPLVKNNLAERAILGPNLMHLLSIDSGLSVVNSKELLNPETRLDLSRQVLMRALELTDIKLRKSKWELILDSANSSARIFSISSVALRLSSLRE